MIDFGTVRPGTTLYIPFATYDSNDPSASVTMTGFATTDIEVYKDGSATQRASDSGYALLDTDGTDFDTITGIHGFSIDLADNTTAGFWAAGSQYWVVVSSITVDAGTVNFIAATFRIGYLDALINTTIATLASQTSFTLTSGPAEDSAILGCPVVIHDVASAVQLGHGIVSAYTGSTKTVTLAAGTTFTAAAGDNIAIFPPANARWAGATLWGSGAITAGSIASNAITSAKIATDAIGADQIAANAITSSEFAQSAADVVWTSTTRTVSAATNITSTGGTTVPQTGDSYARLGAPAGASVSADIATVDANVDAILVDTAEIGAAGAGLTAVPWNAAWDAEVESEATDALNAYDPPTKAELDSGLAALNDPTAAAIADAVWDEAATGHTDAGKAGEQLWTDIDAVLTDTGTTLDGKIDTIDANVDSILDDTGTAGVVVASVGSGAISSSSFAAGAIDTAAVAAGVVGGIDKNATFSNFMFVMRDSTNHDPATGLTITATRSIDAGAFGAAAGTVAEIGNGVYQFDAAAADTNGDVITWRFSATGADDTFFTFRTIP